MTIAAQSDDIRLVSLVSAKLCHDLLGPLSALNMIAESLEDEDPDMLATSRTMILDSAAKAINRLSFFRAAIGRGQNLGSNEARGLIEKVLAESKVTTRWDDSLSGQAGDSGPSLLKLALNLAYLAGHAIIGGGAIVVRLDGNAAAPTIAVTATAQRLNFEDAARRALIAGAAADEAAVANLDARAAYAYYAGRVAANLGLALNLPDAKAATLEILAARR
jgi:histidine phosphotransferase ChpT